MGGKKRKEVERTVNQPIPALEKKNILILNNVSLKMACLILLLICLAVKMYAVLYKKQHKHLLPIGL